MKKRLKAFFLWMTPGFLLWLVLSYLNARVYIDAQEAGKFPPEADTIMIPILGFTGALAVGLMILTLAVFLITLLFRKLLPRFYPLATVLTLMVIGIGIYIPYQSHSEQRNLEFISRDLEMNLPLDTKVIRHDATLGFDVDFETCSILELDTQNLSYIDSKIHSNVDWVEFKGKVAAKWKGCFDDAQGVALKSFTHTEGKMRSQIVVGIDQKNLRLIYAFISHYLARDEK